MIARKSMRKRSKGKTKKSEPYAEVPPGGRAFQRIQQDRIARGLGEISKQGELVLEVTKPTAKQRQTKRRKTKPARRY